jgi:hypothetical protein
MFVLNIVLIPLGIPGWLMMAVLRLWLKWDLDDEESTSLDYSSPTPPDCDDSISTTEALG